MVVLDSDHLVLALFYLPVFLLYVFLPEHFNRVSLLLGLLELVLREFLGMRGIMGEQEQFLEVMLLALERPLDGGQLVVIADSFLIEPLDDALIHPADGLDLIVLDHDLVQLVFEHPDVAHQGRLLQQSKLPFLNFPQLVLQVAEGLLFFPGNETLLVQLPAPVLHVPVAVARARGHAPGSCGGNPLFRNQLVPYLFQIFVLVPQNVDDLGVALLGLFGLVEKLCAVVVDQLGLGFGLLDLLLEHVLPEIDP